MEAADIQPFFADEMQLAGWTETHNGGCKVTFWLSSPEALEKFRTMTVRKGNMAGQRVMAVLVELNEQEEPESIKPVKAPAAPMGPLCMDAVSRCNRPEFQSWITRDTKFAATMAGADGALKARIGITSRRQLDTDAIFRCRWQELIDAYRQHQQDTGYPYG